MLSRSTIPQSTSRQHLRAFCPSQPAPCSVIRPPVSHPLFLWSLTGVAITCAGHGKHDLAVSGLNVPSTSPSPPPIVSACCHPQWARSHVAQLRGCAWHVPAPVWVGAHASTSLSEGLSVRCRAVKWICRYHTHRYVGIF
jgi:hypothetical protein